VGPGLGGAGASPWGLNGRLIGRRSGVLEPRSTASAFPPGPGVYTSSCGVKSLPQRLPGSFCRRRLPPQGLKRESRQPRTTHQVLRSKPAAAGFLAKCRGTDLAAAEFLARCCGTDLAAAGFLARCCGADLAARDSSPGVSTRIPPPRDSSPGVEARIPPPRDSSPGVEARTSARQDSTASPEASLRHRRFSPQGLRRKSAGAKSVLVSPLIVWGYSLKLSGLPADFGPSGDNGRCRIPLGAPRWERRHPAGSWAKPTAERAPAQGRGRAKYRAASLDLCRRARQQGRRNPARGFPRGCFPRAMPFVGARLGAPRKPPTRRIEVVRTNGERELVRHEVPTVRVPRSNCPRPPCPANGSRSTRTLPAAP
jgi:hypothetical protein